MTSPPERKDWPIEVDPVFGCWLWAGRLDQYGYGQLWRGKFPVGAHRAVYRELVGDIPEGKRLDHLCRRRHCVRPDHLDPVSESDNQKRRTLRGRLRQSECRNGHDINLNGMMTPEGGRLCRICQGPSRR